MNGDARKLEAKLPVSEATRKRNPHLYPMGGVAADRTERAPLPALEQGQQKQPGRKKSVGGRAQLRVELTQYRHRLLDPDAIAAAAKPLTDAIAKRLGVDDADPVVEWEWNQVKTGGPEGVLVTIFELT